MLSWVAGHFSVCIVLHEERSSCVHVVSAKHNLHEALFLMTSGLPDIASILYDFFANSYAGVILCDTLCIYIFVTTTSKTSYSSHVHQNAWSLPILLLGTSQLREGELDIEPYAIPTTPLGGISRPNFSHLWYNLFNI